MVAALALATGACETGPRPLAANDQCAYCQMAISDPRFGAELLTRTGKVYTFDSIECLASYTATLPDPRAVQGTWVADFRHPTRLIPASRAVFVRLRGVGSPMGRGLAAVPSRAAAIALLREMGNRQDTAALLSWGDVLGTVRPPVHDAVAPDSGGVAHTSGRAGIADIIVGAHGVVRTLTEALALARAGDHIRIQPGVYREPTLVVRTPVTIEGEPGAVLDGGGEREIMIIAAPQVTVRGVEFRNVGTSFVQDRAALRVGRVRGCTIEHNRFSHTFFAIYLEGASYCRIRDNDIQGDGRSQTLSGNGIHLWYADHVDIEGNHIRRQRDGIYFEFTSHADVRNNVSEENQRYGLHFMFSDSCEYRENTFRHNVAGVAVMYSKHVSMIGNHFVQNWGSAAYGLLLKEITDGELRGNQFRQNSVGLDIEGANRLGVFRNTFQDNGWAVKLVSDAADNRFAHNNFLGNTFDVATSGRQDYDHFSENYWDAYHGYDLDHDGRGDAPFRPVRLFSVLVAHNPPVLILLRSPIVALFDAAERAFPALTPEAVIDSTPLMRPGS